jgi:hypothetical protein
MRCCRPSKTTSRSVFGARPLPPIPLGRTVDQLRAFAEMVGASPALSCGFGGPGVANCPPPPPSGVGGGADSCPKPLADNCPRMLSALRCRNCPNCPHLSALVRGQFGFKIAPDSFGASFPLPDGLREDVVRHLVTGDREGRTAGVAACLPGQLELIEPPHALRQLHPGRGLRRHCRAVGADQFVMQRMESAGQHQDVGAQGLPR